MTFKAKDQVQMVSGGPIMTVEKVEDGQATVWWFDDKNKLMTGTIPVAVLTLYQEDNASGFHMA